MNFLQKQLEIKSMKLGLERMQLVDQALSFPSRSFPSIHVAGTNGKGSVTTKIARALAYAGYKVGLYTSPHIESYHERIEINGKKISEVRAEALLKRILALNIPTLSYFELLTILAFLYFAEEKVDYAVIETGMGGRLDATNIVAPILSVITSIEKDHTTHLGNTLEAIAQEKAGIIKPKVAVILGPRALPYAVFQTQADKEESPLTCVTGYFAHYEEENRAVAREALMRLGLRLAPEVIERGLNAVPPCRFEEISKQGPLVILDVAHNPDGLERTGERLRHTFAKKPIRVVAGFSADKAIDECLKVVNQYACAVHLTHAEHYRLAPLGEPIENSCVAAYQLARERDEILLVCGTFFIMAPARAVLSRVMKEQKSD